MSHRIIFFTILILLFKISAFPCLEPDIRGSIATGTDTWTADNFPGFYYDIDDNIKTEELITTVTDRTLLEPDGIVYNTKTMAEDFDYDAWGEFLVIGFLGEKYFAGYINAEGIDDILFEKSDDENVLIDEQLLKILADNDDEMTVTSSTPLVLEDGYELSVKSIDIDRNMVYLELSKDGAVVDSKVISPSADNAGMDDETYYYKKDIGDSEDIVIVAVHFKNAFRGADQNLATVDGLWQLSDTATDVSENTEYNKMTIQTVTSDSIMMNNEDNDIILNNGKDISLMESLRIKTADPSADEGDVLRYYPYKEISEPGTYEIRGNVATESATWTADTFAGFYYDIDDNIKTEELTTTVTDRKLLEPDGIVYNTKTMAEGFDYDAWGEFLVIGFLGEKYFAGYINAEGIDDILFEKSDDENVLIDEQLLKILADNDDEMTVTSSTPLVLEDGYELSIKSIDIDQGMVYLELSKDGAIVDNKVISPSADNAEMDDKTYYYKKDIGDSEDIVIVAVHFKNAFRGADQNLATVDGLWQLSDTATDVSENTEYNKMTIQTVTSDSIMMNNEDNDIILNNGKDISLMESLRIKTADPSADEGDVLRWYIYKEVTIEEEGTEFEDPAPIAVEGTAAAAVAAESEIEEGPTKEKEEIEVESGRKPLTPYNIISSNEESSRISIDILWFAVLIISWITILLISLNKGKISCYKVPSFLKYFFMTSFSMVITLLIDLSGLNSELTNDLTIVFFSIFSLSVVIDKIFANMFCIIINAIAMHSC